MATFGDLVTLAPGVFITVWSWFVYVALCPVRSLLFFIVLVFGALGGIGLRGAPLAGAQEAESCGGEIVGSGRDTAPLVDAVAVVLDDVDGLFAEIEARNDFGVGWLDDGEVAQATEKLRDDISTMANEAATILEGRGWALEGDWQIPANELPVSPEVSLVTEIWNASQSAFPQNLADLGDLNSRSAVIEFWTFGASPCGTAGTLAGIANSLPTSLPPVERGELADTGVDSVWLTVFGLAVLAAGVLLVTQSRKHAKGPVPDTAGARTG